MKYINEVYYEVYSEWFRSYLISCVLCILSQGVEFTLTLTKLRSEEIPLNSLD